MTKKRSVNKEIHYKDIIQKQKKIIQQLKKQNGRAGKIEERYADLDDREAELLLEEEEESRPSTNTCPRCKDNLDIIEGSRVKVFLCQNCGYRATKQCSK